ncbi:MAG: UDP-N-acetylmuramoyl-tripeptide--D-alanyl-D-alanine ligase [Candidatus Omnitrophota bacterium]|nr:MAG: UDP-N-acetylmuramoyl-tripeptide--D-alanyl-D-alanine ligase [Candidatus Omnitrophota bacterium]
MLLKEVLQATEIERIEGSKRNHFSGVSIDSRTIREGELFIALKGKRFDGHKFVKEAIRKGARGAIVSLPLSLSPPSTFSLLYVLDTLKALGDISAYLRRKSSIPIIGITGSNGKSTVKELIAFLLSRRYRVLKNKGNENNYIGVSLTLLRLNPAVQVGVVEMGTNHFGEIRRLSKMIEPTVGVITNIGYAHLEFFKSIEGVYEAKLELIEGLRRDGLLVIDGRDKTLYSRAKERFRGEVIGVKEEVFSRNLIHPQNLAIAFAVCERMGIDKKEMRERIKVFQAPPMRMQMKEKRGIRIINDAYNSNPSSLSYAIEQLARFGRRRILVVGDMLELGEESEGLHFEIGKVVAEKEIDILISVGKLAQQIGRGADYYGMKGDILHFSSNQETSRYLITILKAGDTVLIKGSRGMRMEEIVSQLEQTL